MALIHTAKTENQYFIFNNGEDYNAVHSPIGSCTSYNSDAWTLEICADETAWLARQDELGLLPVEEEEEII